MMMTMTMMVMTMTMMEMTLETKTIAHEGVVQIAAMMIALMIEVQLVQALMNQVLHLHTKMTVCLMTCLVLRTTLPIHKSMMRRTKSIQNPMMRMIPYTTSKPPGSNENCCLTCSMKMSSPLPQLKLERGIITWSILQEQLEGLMIDIDARLKRN